MPFLLRSSNDLERIFALLCALLQPRACAAIFEINSLRYVYLGWQANLLRITHSANLRGPSHFAICVFCSNFARHIPRHLRPRWVPNNNAWPTTCCLGPRTVLCAFLSYSKLKPLYSQPTARVYVLKDWPNPHWALSAFCLLSRARSNRFADDSDIQETARVTHLERSDTKPYAFSMWTWHTLFEFVFLFQSCVPVNLAPFRYF